MLTDRGEHEISNRLMQVDWKSVAQELNNQGYTLLPDIVGKEECEALIKGYNSTNLYRKIISMERYRFGVGEYKYFSYPLPDIIQKIHEEVYSKLAPIANRWMEVLKKVERFPLAFEELQTLCHSAGQLKPTPLILKYGEGGYNTLHQDLYGEVFFPIQLVVFLNEPGTDYKGGEFVMTEQRPRAQSKAIVLTPKKGDILIFTTNFRQ